MATKMTISYKFKFMLEYKDLEISATEDGISTEVFTELIKTTEFQGKDQNFVLEIRHSDTGATVKGEEARLKDGDKVMLAQIRPPTILLRRKPKTFENNVCASFLYQ
jgi:hypothetical protein